MKYVTMFTKHKALAVVALLALTGCGANSDGGKMISGSASTPDTTREELQVVAGLRIAFGHQSVGSNIVEGIARIAAESGVAMRVAESRNPMASPTFQHFKIGENEFPVAKMEDFEGVMRSGVAETAQVALMKLCYIDFRGDADPVQLANTYIATIDRLSEAYGNTTFVPMTAPLTTAQTGPKAWVKRLLGKALGGHRENVRRSQFNSVLRQHYGNDDRLFDLAAIESGSGSTSFTHDGKEVEALNPDLTDDGGHLNAAGQRAVGSALVRHLARLGKGAGAAD